MRPFAAFWKQLDIDDQVDLGLLSGEDTTQARNHREALKRALRQFFPTARPSKSDEHEILQMVQALLGKQAASPAEFLMINLEDLWAETRPQNTPGTVDERPNWRRRARFGFEAVKRMRSMTGLLRKVDRLRKG